MGKWPELTDVAASGCSLLKFTVSNAGVDMTIRMRSTILVSQPRLYIHIEGAEVKVTALLSSASGPGAWKLQQVERRTEESEGGTG